MSNEWKKLNDSISATITKANESVVQIRTDQGNIGAGTIWREDGLILTNAHVVTGKHVQYPLYVVMPNNDSYVVKTIVTDEKRDIAALEIDAGGLPTIAIGDSETLQAGQYALAIGHPWGVVDSVSSGVIIGVGAKLPEHHDEQAWIAMDLTLRPGHSGGPLLNESGEIVGINTMIRGPEVGLAIPVSDVKKFVRRLPSTRDKQSPPQKRADEGVYI